MAAVEEQPQVQAEEEQLPKEEQVPEEEQAQPEITNQPSEQIPEIDEEFINSEEFSLATKFIVSQFLDERHYSQMHRSLSSKWDREHSLSAAIKLMNEYGVCLSDEESDELAKLDETQQIHKLVSLMPQQSNEQFQQFFLQLQLIVSTAQRIKQALQAGLPDEVRQALDDAEGTGIAPYILKMAIVQAGSEVSSLRTQFQAWSHEADQEMSKLIRGQTDAVEAQKRLAAAQAQLSQTMGTANDKAKKAMMNFSAGNPKMLMATMYIAWRDLIKQLREEAEIRAEFEYKIEEAEQRLMNMRMKQLDGARATLGRKAAEGDKALTQAMWKIFQDIVAEARWEKENAEQLAFLEEKLKNNALNQANNAKSVMGRIGNGGDQELLNVTFGAWYKSHEEYLKDKETNDAVKAAEARMRAFQQGHKEKGKGLLAKMAEATGTGLLKEIMDSWASDYADAKAQAEMEALMEANSAKFASLQGRNGDSAKSVMERARKHQEEMVYRRHWNAWRIDARLSKLMTEHQTKIDAKKQQLHGVQTLFRQFAAQLESNLKDQDSARELYKRRTKTMTNKSAGSASLPDIRSGHATPQGSSRQAWVS